jgi:hypothetical protein
MNSLQNITTFWNWFDEKSIELLKDPLDESLISLLDDKILTLNGVTWEIGPTHDPAIRYLAISPNLRKELVPICESIISMAPELEFWRFYIYRQPKIDWKGIYSILHKSGNNLNIDVNNWRFIIYQYTDKMFEIDILNIENSYLSLGESFVQEIIELALINIIGEQVLMLYLLKFQHIEEELDTPSLNFREASNFFRIEYL